VPFYIRTGKSLPKRVSEIAIQFRTAPLAMFRKATAGAEALPNVLILRIQPEEGISLNFVSKRPGSGMQLRPVSMDFNYGSSFGERSPSAYETLLLDAITATPRSTPGRTWWRQAGRPCSRSSITGARRNSTSRTTRRVRGDRRRPTKCWPAGDTLGEGPNDTGKTDQAGQNPQGAERNLVVDGEADDTQAGDTSAQGGGVLRACAMTLISFVDDEEDSQSLERNAGGPDERTPQPLRGGAPERRRRLPRRPRVRAVLDAVRASPQICCEQIEITSSMNRLADVAAIVGPLAVPDLPRVILLRSARIVRAGALRKILPLGDKIIVDSNRAGAPWIRRTRRPAGRRTHYRRPRMDANHRPPRPAGRPAG
jgi:hypothetical protein